MSKLDEPLFVDYAGTQFVAAWLKTSRTQKPSSISVVYN
jgi:hypothetical protein